MWTCQIPMFNQVGNGIVPRYIKPDLVLRIEGCQLTVCINVTPGTSRSGRQSKESTPVIERKFLGNTLISRSNTLMCLVKYNEPHARR